MLPDHLPTYAIVELLIRLAEYNSAIGNYKSHSFYNNGIMVKTSGGSINFSRLLVIQQFEAPELIAKNELIAAAGLFIQSQ